MSRKGRVSLFEVMSSAPQVQYPKRRKGLFGSKPDSEEDAAPIPTVAEALTEEEAMAEIAAQQRAAEEKQRAAEEKRREREEKRAAKRAAKAAKRAAAIEAAAHAEKTVNGSPVRVSRGRVIFSLGSVGGVTTAAAICVLMLVAYSLGRKSTHSEGGNGLRPAAAIKTPAARREMRMPAATDETSADEGARSAELVQLLRQPPAKQESVGVVTNVPARVPTETAAVVGNPEDLNYLQIESFLVQRHRSGDVLEQDLAEVRRFLAERGIETQARKVNSYFVLYSAQGFKTGAEGRDAREAFRRKIEKLGAEYRKSGGLYEFKGCDFVSYGKTQTGRPV